MPLQRRRRKTRLTVADLHRDRLDPVCSLPHLQSVSILQAACWLMDLKTSCGHVTDGVINCICGLVHKLLLPAGNRWPPSLHFVRAILEVPDASHFEDHVCCECWRVFTRLPRAAWDAHADDVCVCGHMRFSVGTNGVPRPVRVAYVLPVAAVVARLVSDPINAAHLFENRLWDDPASFWGSPGGKQLDADYDYLFSRPRLRQDGVEEVAVILSVGVPLHLALRLKACTALPAISSCGCAFLGGGDAASGCSSCWLFLMLVPATCPSLCRWRWLPDDNRA